MSYPKSDPRITRYPMTAPNPLGELAKRQGIQNIDDGMWVDSEGHVEIRTLDEADGVPFRLPTEKLEERQ